MITEGIIISIDYNSNSGVIRIPIFENVNSAEPVVLNSKIAIQPGMFNGYKVGDRVWVAFAENKVERPVIISKIYDKPQAENSCLGGNLNVGSLNVTSNQATIPQETQLRGNYKEFDSIVAIIHTLKTLKQTVELQQTIINELESKVNTHEDTIAQLEEQINNFGVMSQFIITDSTGQPLYDKNNELLVTKDANLAKK